MTIKRVIAGAALLHVILAVALCIAGRSGVAPRAVDRYGVVESVDADSYWYREQAAALAAVLRQRGVSAWRANAAGAPLHVQLLSWEFVAFSPIAGESVLAAEPWNLACYLAIVGLAFGIARECGSARGAVVAAAVVALWPSLLFHTLQFLKDPAFIAGALALILIITTWLTRRYEARHAFAAAIVLMSAAALLLRIRSQFAFAVFALAAFGLILLIIRQLSERRVLVWNLSCAILVTATASLILLQSKHTLERYKAFPSPATGEPKTAAGRLQRVPTAIAWRDTTVSPLYVAVDNAALSLGSARSRYNRASIRARTGIDTSVEFRNPRDVIAYLPRAMAVGLWAPFPAQWMQPGGATGRASRLAAGAETLAMYGFELLALIGVVLPPRRLPSLLLFVTAAFGVTALALIVSNVGTLYRFRYAFWVLFIVAGASGGEKLLRRRANLRAIAVVASCLALLTASCAQPRRNATDLRVAIVNDAGWKIGAIYISPTTDAAWGENILGGTIAGDGDTIVVRFPAAARSTRWDLRVDGARRFSAVWKQLDLANLSSVTLHSGSGIVVAELQPSATPRRDSSQGSAVRRIGPSEVAGR